MKKLLFFMILFLIVGCTKASIKKEQNQKKQITVLREYNTLKEVKTPRRRIIIGKIKNYSRFGTQRTDTLTKKILISELINTNRFEILEDKNLDTILEELSTLKVMKERDMLEIQRFLSADYIISGEILKYELKPLEVNSFFYKGEETHVEVSLELKILNVATGEMWSEIGEGISNIRVKGSYGALEENTLKIAIIDGVEKIIKKIDKLPWSTAILEKKGKELKINSNSNDLELDTELIVYQQYFSQENLTEENKYRERVVGKAIVESYLTEETILLKYDGVDFSLPAVVKLK